MGSLIKTILALLWDNVSGTRWEHAKLVHLLHTGRETNLENQRTSITRECSTNECLLLFVLAVAFPVVPFRLAELYLEKTFLSLSDAPFA